MQISTALPIHAQPLELGHHDIHQRVDDAEVMYDEPLVRIVASIEAHPDKAPGPGRHRSATTLAVRMDRVVAMKLWKQLGDLARSMDWQPPE